MKNPDPTPVQYGTPAWARQLQGEVYELRRDHNHLKSKVEADNMATIHLLANVATTVQALQVDVLKLNKQIWGAIKQLRKAKGAKKK